MSYVQYTHRLLNSREHAREIVASVISGVFTEIDERARLHQLTTWYDISNFKYTSPKNYDICDGRDTLFDFECWTRIGPFCDAPNAVPILASDAPDFLRNILDGLVKVQRAYLMALLKFTADQSIGMECKHALEPSSAMCVTCTLIAMLSRLMKKSHGITDMRAVYCVLAICMRHMLAYVLLKQGERVWAVRYATAHAHASALMLHTRPRLTCRSRLRSAPVLMLHNIRGSIAGCDRFQRVVGCAFENYENCKTATTASECRTIGADESLRPCSSFGPLSFPREGEMWGPGQRVPGPTLITADHALSPLLTWPR